MAGIVRGSTEHFINHGNVFRNHIDAFKVLYDYFNSLATDGSASIVALQTGSTAYVTSPGTDWYGTGNGFGENAFFVVKMERPSTIDAQAYYLMFQFARSALFGDPPGSPGRINGATGSYFGHGYQAVTPAAGITRFDEIWNGTANADGNDMKGDPVWKSSGIGTIFPLTNVDDAGVYDSKKDDMGAIWALLGGSTRIHIVGDEDTTCILCDPSNTNAYYALIVGMLDVPAIADIANPMAVLGDSLPFDEAQLYGSYTAIAVRHGGIARFDNAFPRNAPLYKTRYTNYAVGSYSPNRIISSSVYVYDELPMHIVSYGPSYAGYIGVFDSRVVCDIIGSSDEDANINRTRAYFDEVSIQWDGATVPGTGTTSGGLQWQV